MEVWFDSVRRNATYISPTHIRFILIIIIVILFYVTFFFWEKEILMRVIPIVHFFLISKKIGVLV